MPGTGAKYICIINHCITTPFLSAFPHAVSSRWSICSQSLSLAGQVPSLASHGAPVPLASVPITWRYLSLWPPGSPHPLWDGEGVSSHATAGFVIKFYWHIAMFLYIFSVVELSHSSRD